MKAKNENRLIRAHARGNKERARSRAGGWSARLREEEEPDGSADAALWVWSWDEICRLSCVTCCFGANVSSVYLVRGKLLIKANKCSAR